MSEINFSIILKDKPPGCYKNVQDVLYQTTRGMISSEEITAVKTPELQLFCDNEKCKGIRTFSYPDYPFIHSEIEYGYYPDNAVFIEYLCQNCQEYNKIYALIIDRISKSHNADVTKVGEYPFYDEPIPTILFSILGPDKELFLKGKRSESQNLGIAAFSYYRRVIENQKNRLISLIGKVISSSGEDEHLEVFEKAKGEYQFSKSVDLIQNYLPKNLFIENENPLKLIHKVLSQGIHNFNDQECLELAQNLRIVLIEFTKRLNDLKQNQNKIKAAVNILNKKRG